MAFSLRRFCAWATMCGAMIGYGQHGFAWGAQDHKAINHAAVTLMQSPLQPLFQNNLTSLERMATVPDNSWKNGPGASFEAATHYFHWDEYLKSPVGNAMPMSMQQALTMLDGPTVKNYGIAVWRVQQLYDLLVAALKAKNWNLALQMAGTLGHYVGDLAQPMHNTSDYDGQSIGRRGIHSYFETTILKDIPYEDLWQEAAKRAASQNPTVMFDDTAPTQVSWDQSVEAYNEMPDLLGIFQEDAPMKPRLLNMAYDKLGLGAKNLARIWDMAAQAAGVTAPLPDTKFQPKVPARVPTGLEGIKGLTDDDSFIDECGS